MSEQYIQDRIHLGLQEYMAQTDMLEEYKRHKAALIQDVKGLRQEQKEEYDFRLKARDRKPSLSQISVVVGFGTGIVVLLLVLFGVI